MSALSGTATSIALRVFLSRHPDCPRKKVGSRLVFSRSALQAWIEQREARRGKAA